MYCLTALVLRDVGGLQSRDAKAPLFTSSHMGLQPRTWIGSAQTAAFEGSKMSLQDENVPRLDKV